MFKSDEEVGRMVALLLQAVNAMAERNRMARTTVATAVGVTPTRLAQLQKAARDGQPVMVGLDVFLRFVTLCKAEKQMVADGVLPAASKRGQAQHAILEYCGVLSEPSTDE
jgi:hypothetical protein